MSSGTILRGSAVIVARGNAGWGLEAARRYFKPNSPHSTAYRYVSEGKQAVEYLSTDAVIMFTDSDADI